MTRSLRLAKETLTDLSAGEMAAVAGAGPALPSLRECPLSGAYPTLPVTWCVDYTLDQTW
jgi:hypothetical protein